MIANGVIINGIEVPTEDIFRLVFFGETKENVLVAFKATPDRRGHRMTTGKTATQTNVQIFSNGIMIYEANEFMDIAFELAPNSQSVLIEQVSLYKQS